MKQIRISHAFDQKLSPQISGANILLRWRNSVLLQLRDNNPNISFPNYWALPGGQTKSREVPEETARRELIEECGYKMAKPQLLLRKTVTKDNGVIVDEAVFAEEYDCLQEIQCFEGQAFKFFSAGELNKIKIVPWQKKVIEKVFKKKKLNHL